MLLPFNPQGALGAVSSVTGAVSSAVKSELLTAGSFRQGGADSAVKSGGSSSSSEAAWAPTSWLFGAGKQLQVREGFIAPPSQWPAAQCHIWAR